MLSERSAWRLRRAAVLLIFLLPFLLRLVYFLETRHADYLGRSILVAHVNHTFAADLARGSGAPYEIFRSPWYALAVSLIYRLLDPDPLAIRAIQWLLGACGCLLVYATGRTLFGRTTGLIAFAIAGLYAPAIFLEGDLLEQSAASFLALASVALLSRTMAPGAGSAIVIPAAAVYGLAFLLRPDLLAAAPWIAAAVAAAPAPPRVRAARAVLFLLGCLIMAGPIAAPGLFLDLSASRLDVNLAINLYLGNNAEANGLDPRFPETPELDTTEPEAIRRHMTGLDLAGVRYAMGRTGGDISTVPGFWLARAARFVSDSPVRFAALETRKALLFLGGRIHGNQKDIYFAREFSLVLRILVFCAGICFPLGIIIPLALVGAAMGGKREARLLLLAVPAGCLVTTLAFFHDQRFQHIAVPGLILLAARGAVRLGASARERRWAPWALLLMALTVSNVDLTGSGVDRSPAEWFRLGAMRQDRGEIAGAFDAYRRSIRLDSRQAPPLDNLVFLAMTSGRTQEAVSLLEDLDAAGRPSAPLIASLIRLYGGTGRHEEAARLGRRAIVEYPASADVYAALGDTLAAAGRLEEAALTYARGIRVIPEDPLLGLGLCDLRARQGRCAEALPWCMQVVEAAAPYPRAWAVAGACLLSLGEDLQAADLLMRGCTLHPDDPGVREALLRVARSLAAQGRSAEAIACAVKARDLGHAEAADLVRELTPVD